jgi:hypothetical protein
MAICRALLKYGYSGFSLEILEYCEPSEAISREQFFIDLLQPDYNILAIAGSSLGFKQSEETKAKISAANKGENHPNFGKPRPSGSGKPSQKLEVTDLETNISTVYNSIGAAAKDLNINRGIISGYFNRNQIKPYRGRYVFTKI